MACSIAWGIPFSELLKWHPRDIATYVDIRTEQAEQGAGPKEVGYSNVVEYGERPEWAQ